MDIDELAEKVIGAAIEVHRKIGPGLLESVYTGALAHELKKAGIPFEKEKEIPVEYDGDTLGIGFRCDFLIDDRLIVECKSSRDVTPIDVAQTITYITLSGMETGLLINFNVMILKDGIRRLFRRK